MNLHVRLRAIERVLVCEFDAAPKKLLKTCHTDVIGLAIFMNSGVIAIFAEKCRLPALAVTLPELESGMT